MASSEAISTLTGLMEEASKARGDDTVGRRPRRRRHRGQGRPQEAHDRRRGDGALEGAEMGGEPVWGLSTKERHLVREAKEMHAVGKAAAHPARASADHPTAWALQLPFFSARRGTQPPCRRRARSTPSGSVERPAAAPVGAQVQPARRAARPVGAAAGARLTKPSPPTATSVRSAPCAASKSRDAAARAPVAPVDLQSTKRPIQGVDARDGVVVLQARVRRLRRASRGNAAPASLTRPAVPAAARLE